MTRLIPTDGTYDISSFSFYILYHIKLHKPQHIAARPLTTTVASAGSGDWP